MHHEPGLPRLRGRPGGSPRGRPWTATSGCRAPARPDRPRKLSAVRGSGGRYHLQERWRSHATRLRGTPPRHAGVRGVQPGGHRPACLPTAGGHRRYRANRTSHPAGQVASGACQCRAGSRYSGARTTAAAMRCAPYGRHSSSGSLAKFTANRRASSLVSSFAAERRPGSSSKLEIAGSVLLTNCRRSM